MTEQVNNFRISRWAFTRNCISYIPKKAKKKAHSFKIPQREIRLACVTASRLFPVYKLVIKFTRACRPHEKRITENGGLSAPNKIRRGKKRNGALLRHEIACEAQPISNLHGGMNERKVILGQAGERGRRD